jgi:hypothetical protein
LAGAVNAIGAENGLALHYDRTSVAHWMSGSRPSALVVGLVAEALSRRLGRPVSPAETGLIRSTGGTDQADGRAALDVVDQLRQLGRAEGTHKVLRRLPYRLALDLPGITDLAATVPPVARGLEPVGGAHVAAATSMLSVFSAADTAFGGGFALPALSVYVGMEVSSWLVAPAGPVTHARLCSAASRLAALAGRMCFDDILHGAAQRYLRAAAALAALAGDTGSYAAALRGLSLQANHLGHHAIALDIAIAAGRHSAGLPRAEAAFLAGQLAVTHAACGHRGLALDQIGIALRLLRRAEETGAAGAYHAAVLAYRQAETLTVLGDRPAAIEALNRTLRHLSPAERRDHAIVAARLAELYLDTGRLDRACAAWSMLLDDYPQLSSGRVEWAIRSMRARLRPHRTHTSARALLIRASGSALTPFNTASHSTSGGPARAGQFHG